MKKKNFIRKLSEILDMDAGQIDEKTNLKQLDGYDSIAIITIIAFIDEELGIMLPPEEFGTVTTVESLIKLVGLDHFA